MSHKGPNADDKGSTGAPGLGLLFAFLGFFGFEATAVFRNEARDPDHTVPRATYIAVLGIGTLCTLSSWLVISEFTHQRTRPSSPDLSEGSTED